MIRSAIKSDASRIAEILIFTKRAHYRTIFHNDYVSFHEMQVLDLALFYRDDPEARTGVYVYEDGGIVKGMMSMGRKHQEKDGLELKELFIDPFFQGQGIGTDFMKYLCSCGRNEQRKRAFLWVLEGNHKARRFYEKFGFCSCGEKKRIPGTEQNEIKYVKTL